MAGVLTARDDLKDKMDTPIVHILRPHHISFLILIKTWFDEQTYQMHPKLQLVVYKLLLDGVTEITPPPPWPEMMSLIEKTAEPLESDETWYLNKIRRASRDVNTVDDLIEFFEGIRPLYSADDESPLWTRSLFGFFCRRCNVSFRKLSYHGVDHLLRGFKNWENGECPSYAFEKVDPLRSETKTWRPEVDKSFWAVPSAFLAFEEAAATNDVHMAEEHLRAFFEQRFLESGETNLRQHALLNLARVHYKWGGFKQAHKYIQEAISVARTLGDKVTIQYCMSLLRRWTLGTSSGKPPLNEIQSGIPAMEVLRDALKLLTNDQPLGTVLEKIYASIAIYDLNDERLKYQESDEQWGQHAMQAIVWRLAGCFQLADMEDEIVLANTPVAGNDDCRLKTILGRAAYMARQGRYDDALSTLLEPDVWRGMEGSNYKEWVAEICTIFELRSSRRGSSRVEQEFLRTRRPRANVMSEASAEVKKTNGSVEDLFRMAIMLRRQGRVVGCLDPTLTGLWRVEFLGRWHLYRLGIALLADAGLELGLTVWCRKLMDEILPQVISGDELELRALGCVVYARCIVLAGESSDAAIKEAMPYLQLAEQDYTTLEIVQSTAEVQYMLSVFYHNLGITEARDAAAQRHLDTEATAETYAKATVDATMLEIWKLVEDIGVALGSRDVYDS